MIMMHGWRPGWSSNDDTVDDRRWYDKCRRHYQYHSDRVVVVVEADDDDDSSSSSSSRWYHDGHGWADAAMGSFVVVFEWISIDASWFFFQIRYFISATVYLSKNKDDDNDIYVYDRTVYLVDICCCCANTVGLMSFMSLSFSGLGQLQRRISEYTEGGMSHAGGRPSLRYSYHRVRNQSHERSCMTKLQFTFWIMPFLLCIDLYIYICKVNVTVLQGEDVSEKLLKSNIARHGDGK